MTTHEEALVGLAAAHERAALRLEQQIARLTEQIGTLTAERDRKLADVRELRA